MAKRKIEIIFGEGQASEELLCEALHSILHPEAAVKEGETDSGEAA